jgi:glycine/D-amino acid oxidase-like deaminating enzyme
VRVCVTGGGLAGSLLAWRLAQRPGIEVDLLTGPGGVTDATAASGGAVRAYDPLPGQRELAIASLAELLASRVLRQWADYRQTGFAYLRDAAADLAAEVAEVERVLPGSAELTTPAEVFPAEDGRPGWTGDGPEAAVRERRAGYISPAALRNAVIADLAGRQGARVLETVLDTTTTMGARYDVVVLAAGAWTARLLHALGMPAAAYRTRFILYAVYEAGTWRPPGFADERTGLYGRPTADGGLLLGVPTTEWDVPPGATPATGSRPDRAPQLAAACFPLLKLGQARQRVGAADCYCDPPVLALRAVAPGWFTFTGGSGGAVKSALAASERAARELT